MKFPHDPLQLARHPSQLYEAFLEGLVLFIILWVYSAKPRATGAVTGLFLLCYGTFRFLVEFVREPDADIGFVIASWGTMGQVLSLPLIIFGLILIYFAKSNKDSSTMTDLQKKQLIQNLDALEIEYDLIACDPELADTRVFVENYGYDIQDCANTILVKSKTGERKFAACVVLAHCRLDVNRTIRKKLKARRVSFASAAEAEQLTGMTVGGVTPIGLPAELPLWVDRAVLEREVIILGGSSRSWKIQVSPKIF